MELNPAGVTVEHLDMEFVARGRRQKVLEDIDLQIAPGEFFVIVGPSGCGKTTLLRILQGLAKPTGGRASIAGRTVTGGPGSTAASCSRTMRSIPGARSRATSSSGSSFKASRRARPLPARRP